MRLRKLSTGIPMVVAAVLLAATPAWATTYGSGSHAGSTTQTNTKISNGCFQTVGSYAGSGPVAGSPDITVTDGTKTYTGTVSTVKWSYSFYQTFAGSTTDSTCANLGAGAPGSATSGQMSGSNGTQTLSCTWFSGSGGTYERVGTGTTALTIDFPASTGGCKVDGDPKVPMHWTNNGGFNQVNGVADCQNASTTHPPSACNETFTSFSLTS